MKKTFIQEIRLTAEEYDALTIAHNVLDELMGDYIFEDYNLNDILDGLIRADFSDLGIDVIVEEEDTTNSVILS